MRGPDQCGEGALPAPAAGAGSARGAGGAGGGALLPVLGQVATPYGLLRKSWSLSRRMNAAKESTLRD